MSITVTIETVSYSLGEFVRKVLGDYSDNYPNKVVRPNQLTCFVVEKKMDRIYYYPVNSIATRSDVRYLIRRNFPSYNVTVADFNINLYSYCQNPLGVQTPVTGAVLVEYEVNGKKIGFPEVYCPQLNKYLTYVSSEDEEYKNLTPMLREGILLLRPIDREVFIPSCCR